MRRIDFQRLAPPGHDLWTMKMFYWCGLGFSIFFSILCFFSRYSQAYHNLFEVSGGLIPGEMMPDFAELLSYVLVGFWIVAIGMLGCIPSWYASFYRESRSIYLMRRLPDRWELHRRCLTLPLAGAALAALLGFLLLLLFFTIYMWSTPASCLTPGQWEKIWRWNG